MFKTGNSFIGYFLIVATFIPLVPVILIFVRRIYGKEPLNSLLLICLLGFLEGFIGTAPSLNTENQSIVHDLFSLLLFGLFVRLFKTYLNGLLKYRLNIFLTGFLSSLITYGLIKGWGLSYFPLDALLSVVLAGIIFLSLPSIVKAGHWQVFRSPLFWIALGTLFYLLLFLLLEWAVPPRYRPLVTSQNPEKMLLLSMADLIRYLLYILAALAYRQEEVEEAG